MACRHRQVGENGLWNPDPQMPGKFLHSKTDGRKAVGVRLPSPGIHAQRFARTLILRHRLCNSKVNQSCVFTKFLHHLHRILLINRHSNDRGFRR
jgi:hypothetical protein